MGTNREWQTEGDVGIDGFKIQRPENSAVAACSLNSCLPPVLDVPASRDCQIRSVRANKTTAPCPSDRCRSPAWECQDPYWPAWAQALPGLADSRAVETGPTLPESNPASCPRRPSPSLTHPCHRLGYLRRRRRQSLPCPAIVISPVSVGQVGRKAQIPSPSTTCAASPNNSTQPVTTAEVLNSSKGWQQLCAVPPAASGPGRCRSRRQIGRSRRK